MGCCYQKDLYSSQTELLGETPDKSSKSMVLSKPTHQNHRHPLSATSCEERLSKSPQYKYGYSCDVCMNVFDKEEISHSCQQCHYDLCPSCSQKRKLPETFPEE
mmetsp:Transcript_42989/g.41354  ORF Transcript_42989/g.41354 Transcript_42989/m.41354 type:complete len:104 (+) Transcript_42989:31-342(+)